MDDTAEQIEAQLKSDHQHSSLSLGETVVRLKAATRQHEGLADAASIAKAQERGADQDAVAQRLARQASDIQGEGQADAAQRRFPELQQPHLVLASAAGLAATTAQSLHLQGGEHVALRSFRRRSPKERSACRRGRCRTPQYRPTKRLRHWASRTSTTWISRASCSRRSGCS